MEARSVAVAEITDTSDGEHEGFHIQLLEYPNLANCHWLFKQSIIRSLIQLFIQDTSCSQRMSNTKTSMGCMMVLGLSYFTKLIKALEKVFVSSMSLIKCSQ